MIIGFNCSCFDLFHAGHVTMLKMEKEKCDYLKVALQVDPTIDRPGLKNKPVQSIYERYVQVQACKYVDEILVYDTEKELLNLIMTQDMNIRFLSDEYLYPQRSALPVWLRLSLGGCNVLGYCCLAHWVTTYLNLLLIKCCLMK